MRWVLGAGPGAERGRGDRLPVGPPRHSASLKFRFAGKTCFVKELGTRSREPSVSSGLKAQPPAHRGDAAGLGFGFLNRFLSKR